MKRIALFSCLLGFCLMILAGCGADSIDLGGLGPNPDPGPTDPPVVMATVSGVIIDSLGSPISGANVAIGGITAVTGADGSYTLEAPAGATVLSVSAQGYESVRVNIELVEGQNTLDSVRLTSEAVNPNTLRGTVTSIVTNAGLEGAEIAVKDPITDELIPDATANTDEFGNYRIENVPAGTYNVNIGAFGYNMVTESVTITNSEPTVLDVLLSVATSYKLYTDTVTARIIGFDQGNVFRYVPYCPIIIQKYVADASAVFNSGWFTAWGHHSDRNAEYGPLSLQDPNANYLVRLGGWACIEPLLSGMPYSAKDGMASNLGDTYNGGSVLENVDSSQFETIFNKAGTYSFTCAPVYPYSLDTYSAGGPILDGHYSVFFDIVGDLNKFPWNRFTIAGNNTIATAYSAGTGTYNNLHLWFVNGPHALSVADQPFWKTGAPVLAGTPPVFTGYDGNGKWKPQTAGRSIPHFFKIPVKMGQQLKVEVEFDYATLQFVDLDVTLYDKNGTQIDGTRVVSQGKESVTRVASTDTFYYFKVDNFLPTNANWNMVSIPYKMIVTKTPEDKNRELVESKT